MPSLVEAIERIAFDDDWREAREARIVATFAPRPWPRVAWQIVAAVGRLAGDGAAAVDRSVQRNLYYPLRLHRRPQVWPGLGSGEIFRAGDGWLWPDADACRTRPAGGELRMRVIDEDAGRSLRLYLRLRGLASAPCPVTIWIAGQARAEAILPAGRIRWVACDLPGGRDISIIVQGAAGESVEMPDGRHLASVSVIGFVLCDPADPGAAFPDDIGPEKLPGICAYRAPVQDR